MLVDFTLMRGTQRDLLRQVEGRQEGRKRELGTEYPPSQKRGGEMSQKFVGTFLWEIENFL